MLDQELTSSHQKYSGTTVFYYEQKEKYYYQNALTNIMKTDPASYLQNSAEKSRLFTNNGLSQFSNMSNING